MLPFQTVAGRIKREGHDAGYKSGAAAKCPYSQDELRRPWLYGWRIGRTNRMLDLKYGNHPDLLKGQK